MDRLAETHQQLTAAVQALTADGQWARMLAAAAKFPRYSASNVLLIMMQKPQATKVAGLRTWNSLGRHVIKGEKSIAILAPCSYPATDCDTDPDKTQSDKGKQASESQQTAPAGSAPAAGEVKKPKEVRGFRVVRVFDVAQTEGAPLPEPPAELRLAGAAPPGMWDALVQLAATDGYNLQRADTGPADGWTNYATRTVRIPAGVDEAHATLTLSHELGHIRADHENRFAGLYATSAKCRGLAEVEAESIGYLVACVAGLPADASSVPYVATWAGGDLDLLRSTAARVITTSRTILTDAGLMPAGLENLAPDPTHTVERAAQRGSAGRWAPTTAGQTSLNAATAALRLIGR
ncbi:MAG TPA: ArdC family protein [Trebonia sp.]